MMKKIAAAFLLLALVFALSAQAEEAKLVAVRYGQNVGAYSKPSPYSRFVGWAKMSGQYPVLDTVTGNRGYLWHLIRLEDGTEGYIPDLMTTPVVKNAEEIALTHVIVHHQGSIHLHRKPTTWSTLMGWAWKTQVYPVIGERRQNGWWPIALPDGTTGYVSGEYAHEYDPEEDTKERWVRFLDRALIYEKPKSDSPVLNGFGPGGELRCVHVCDNGWYEVETVSGGFGFVSPRLTELIEGPLNP